MKATRYFGLLVVFALFLGSVYPVYGSNPGAAWSSISVLKSDAEGILLELKVTNFQVEQISLAGETYHRLSIPDFGQTSQTGYPQVPVYGALLGVPDMDGISIKIVDIETQLVEGYKLLVAQGGSALTGEQTGSEVQQGYPTFDSQIYTENRYYPESPVQITSIGYLRDQKVARVQFYPVQYNSSTGKVKLHKRILAQLSWSSQVTKDVLSPRQESPEFEKLKDTTLLNYKDLSHPSVELRGVNRESERLVTLSTPISNPSLKVGVTEAGIYQLEFNEIVGAGLEIGGVPTSTIRMTNQGNDIPILLQDDGDGVFGSGDAVLFYGVPITNVYTTKNIYWLSANGINGRGMEKIDGTPFVSNVPDGFPNQLYSEKDSYYWQTMTGASGQDRWFWGDEFIAPAIRQYTFNLANIDSTASSATLRVLLKGRTSDLVVNPDHHTKISLNGHELDDRSWDGDIFFDHVITFDHSFLLNGENTLTIEGVGDTGASVDQFFLNWFELDYQDTFVAETNELAFWAPGADTYRFQVDNFDTGNAMVFAIEDPTNVSVFTGVTSQQIDGKYWLEFQGTAITGSRYLVLTPARFKQAASLEFEEASSWGTPTNGADYIIITHEDFYSNTLPLADYRASEAGGSFRVAVVKVQDIYDEFGYGIFNPMAIKDFLRYAYESWQSPAPTYVLLVGEASYDYRETIEPPLSRTNYVPTQMIESQFFGQTAYDNWFAQISGDDYIPDLIVGRIPARSAVEASDMISKAIYYEKNPPDASWNTRTTFISDAGASFESISDQIVGSLPFLYQKEKIYLDTYEGDPTVGIANSINAGSLTVNFIGHGTVNIWANSSVYTAGDVENLENLNKLTVVTVANCLSGFFVGRTNPSIAEAFIRPKDRGAVAVWAPTWFGTPADHKALLQRFYDAIFDEDMFELGAAAWTAEVYLYTLAGPDKELLETYAFFGDPATRIHVVPHNEVYMPSIIK